MGRSADQKLDILLIVRGLLALAVVLWHFTSTNITHYAYLHIPGRTAVWIFFGISGYVISYGFYTKKYLLNRNDIKRFYINRFLRIYPLFFLVSVLSLLTAYLLKEHIAMRLADMPAQFLMLQFNHAYVMNGVFWTLGIELQYYMLVPLLISFFLYPFKHSFSWYGVMYLLFLAWLPAAFFLFGQSFDGRNILSNMTHFLAGMIACRFVLHNQNFRINPIFLSITILVILLGTNYLYYEAIKVYCTLGTVLVDLLIFLLVILHHELNNKMIHKHNIGLRLFSFLGVISYGVYVWHPYLEKYLPFIRNHVLLAICVTILMAFASYQLIEQPILNRKKEKRIINHKVEASLRTSP